MTIAKVESSQVEFCPPLFLPLAGSFLAYFLIIAAFGLLGTWAGSGTNLSLVCSCGCLFGVREVWNLGNFTAEKRMYICIIEYDQISFANLLPFDLFCMISKSDFTAAFESIYFYFNL